jgi:SanA protein
MTGERRTVGGLRLALRRLRAAPLRALAGLGAAAGLAARADAEISAACDGCLFEHVPEVMSREAAIVPGAYVFPDGTPSDLLADRLAAALALVRAGKVARVLVSGGPDEAPAMRAWLRARGAGRVDEDPAGLRTWATMRRAAAVFGVRDAVVCTQRFHLPRALYLARAAGLDALGLVADRATDRASAYNASREQIARMRAWLDVAWTRRTA